MTPELNRETSLKMKRSWCISMRIALEVKNKWSIVDDTMIAPARSHPQYAAWRRCNLLVCSWIFKSVNSSIAQSIIHLDQATDVWEDLKRRFSHHDAQKISSLQSEIYGLKQGTMSVNDYYTRCRTLWEEMNSTRPFPVCRCDPKCSCDLIDQIRKERDTDQVIRFLHGLNDDYSNLKSNVLVLDPLPEANAVQHSQNIPDEVVAAFHSYNGKRSGNSNKGAKCTYCGMNGHTIDKCYKKHGFPPGWISGFKSKGKQGAVMSNNAVENSGNSGNASTVDQLQKLISLLQAQAGQSSGTNATAAVSLVPSFNSENSETEGKYSATYINSTFLCESTWILDSGATDHIVCSLDYFDNYRVVRGAEVNLPTGNSVVVNHVGNVSLNKELCLKDALHIPSFKFNIISVSKLLQDTCNKLIFLSNQCLIQDMLGTRTGIAKQRNGLYLLLEPPRRQDVMHSFAVHCNNSEVWHQRLGHFPINKMHLLSDIKFSAAKTLACDVCHLAKHKRSPFPLSTTSSKNCFDLIHADIWGPFQICSLQGDRYFLSLVDDHSRYTWLHLMRNKSETRQFIKKFHAMVFTQFGTLIKTFRTDNGPEFSMTEFFT
ncbi:PREDICTED: uncharacterized protein LOC109189835 [Ipomoea nil]|uniref:uncharacterized protein LOC109189835 n=1 Tax=Ipomoea nil TaxID=35883 RepID=UPI0009012146|nr:PREDICTED: uncharacterized protein LOC109189835 [Ipomoea nil]